MADDVFCMSHRSTSWVRPVDIGELAWSVTLFVCLSFCLYVSVCLLVGRVCEPIEMPLWADSKGHTRNATRSSMSECDYRLGEDCAVNYFPQNKAIVHVMWIIAQGTVYWMGSRSPQDSILGLSGPFKSINWESLQQRTQKERRWFNHRQRSSAALL